jgi:NADH-quinone oxidoreductase subunit E
MAGSHELMESLCAAADIDRSHADHHHPIAVSPDGTFSIEFAECLASCGTGPVCMVEDDFYEKVDSTVEGARSLLNSYRHR